MAKDGDEATPQEGAVIKTAGEDSARAYAVGELREEGEHPTMEMDRVKIVPPSQTPTVRLAEARKGAGPRAPDQMELPKPRPAVYLPEGRPLTKLQEFEIDEDFLAELRQARLEAGAQLDAEKAAKARGEEAGGAEVETAAEEEGAEGEATAEAGTRREARGRGARAHGGGEEAREGRSGDGAGDRVGDGRRGDPGGEERRGKREERRGRRRARR